MRTVTAARVPADRLPDETLLAGLGAGYAGLSLAFVKRFQGAVFGVAVALLGDQASAEEVAQQAFDRARQAAALRNGPGSVRRWLRSVARDLAVDALRASNVAPADPAALLTAMTSRPGRPAETRDGAEELRLALAALPAGQQRAVAMAGVYAMTAPQIADVEGIAVDAARARISAGMATLRSACLSSHAPAYRRE
jgi:RNA polymerase sigma-70 factor (ECF subfamily)